MICQKNVTILQTITELQSNYCDQRFVTQTVKTASYVTVKTRVTKIKLNI